MSNEKQMFILPIEFNGDCANNNQIKLRNTNDDFYISDFEWNSNTLKNRFKRYKFANCELECQEKHIECNIHLLVFDKEICYEEKVIGLLEFEVSSSIEKAYFENNFREFIVLYNGKRYDNAIDGKKTDFNIEYFLKIEIENVDCKSLENCIYNLKFIESDSFENKCTVDSFFPFKNKNMYIYLVMFELLILEKMHLQKLKDMLNGGWNTGKTKRNVKLREYYSKLYKIENIFEKNIFYDITTKEFNRIKQDFGIYEIKYTCEKNIDRYASILNIDEKIKGNKLLTIINSITLSLAFYEILEILGSYAIRVVTAIFVFFITYFCFNVINNEDN